MERATVHRLKIQLVDISPPIWRRVEVPSDALLPQVSRILLMAMGWTDSHLHAFRTPFVSYSRPDPDFPDDDRDERRVPLARLAPRAKARFVYEYDYGDGWQHRVTVEAIVEPERGVTYPRCIKGKRACPPEDCGGPSGYDALLEVLADPTHDEYEQTIAWTGGQIDPEAFDLVEAKIGIASLAPRTRGRGGKRR